MISSEYRKAITELLVILDNTEEEEIKKIPKNFIKYLNSNADKSYRFEIPLNKSLGELKIKKETKGLLSMVYRNYLCDNNEEKEEFEKILFENEAKYQAELREKYNPDNIFKKPETEVQEEVEETSLVEYKEPLFKRIINKIKNILKLNK